MNLFETIKNLFVKQKKPKVHLVTYGNQNYVKTKLRLKKEAEESKWFDKIFCYGEEDLRKWGYTKSCSGNKGGYYWWKPVVILHALNNIDDGDVLLYLDAGSTIKKEYEKRFNQYINILLKQRIKVLGFYLAGKGWKEYIWTKRDTFKFLNCDEKKYVRSSQVIATMIFFQRDKTAFKLLEEWKFYANCDHIVNNDPSFEPNYEGFIEHRYDQSIFSLLLKKHNGHYIRDESYPPTNKVPLTASRIKDHELP